MPSTTGRRGSQNKKTRNDRPLQRGDGSCYPMSPTQCLAPLPPLAATFPFPARQRFRSVMTYDYPSPDESGPNSPLPWLRENVKLLLHSEEGPGTLANFSSKV